MRTTTAEVYRVVIDEQQEDDMALGDMAKKAKEFLESEKVQQTLKSEKAEGVSDSVLGRVADLADKATGGKHADQIQKARDAADKKFGDR